MSFDISEIRLYQTPNMVNSATIVVSSYSPISAAYSSANLVTNLSNRSLRWDLPPLIDAVNTATYNSCFKVSRSTFTGPYVIGLNHGLVIIQNSVLLVQDQRDGWIDWGTSAELNQYYASQWEVYIGDSPVYLENQKCLGGPHLSSNYDDYSDAYANIRGKPKSPAYGFEKFCNMSG